MLALFIISRKHKHYFQTFSITVLTEHPLRSVVKNPKEIERISRWTSELRSYGFRYEPRTMIKCQVLADFIADFTPGAAEHAEQLEGWILNVDGALNSKGACIEIVLITLEGSIIEQSFTLGFPTFNNKA